MRLSHLAAALCVCCAGAWGDERQVVVVQSSVDHTDQPSLFVPAAGPEAAPLLVLLHWWSAHYHSFDRSGWEAEAAARGWHLLVPEFRGPNFTPSACASPLARQDILDAVAWVESRYAVDPKRVYLAGCSGGAHMALIMAAHAPERWAAVSAWAGISDLAQWHAECRRSGRDYWKQIEAVAGGAPGSSETVDLQLRLRSPLPALREAQALPPLDISTGIHDGHTGSVPVHHTLDAFNVVAARHGAPPVDDTLIESLSRETPGPENEEQDPTYGRRIHLRRYAGSSRVTIFEGGHEAIPSAGCAWLARQGGDAE